MAEELIAYPKADLAGSWQLTAPTASSGGETPTVVSSSFASDQTTLNTPGDADQPDVLSLGGVQDDDVAIIITAVSDGTTTAELTGGDAPGLSGTGSANEIQQFTNYATAGTYTLTFDGQTTAAIDWDATASEIYDALVLLSNIGSSDITVTEPSSNVFRIEFIGALAETPLDLMTSNRPETSARNEVQVLNQTRTSGTFKLTINGVQTVDMDHDLNLAGVRGTVYGGGLHTASTLKIEETSSTQKRFTWIGSYAETNQDEMVLVDSGSGGSPMSVNTQQDGSSGDGIVFARVQAGSAGITFTFAESINIPRGATHEPQIHVWYSVLTESDSNLTISLTLADHDNLDSWAAQMLVVRGLDTSDPLTNFGTEVNGNNFTSEWGTITPEDPGSLVLAIAAKALENEDYDTASQFSRPAGYTNQGSVIGDSIVLNSFVSAPVADSVQQPEKTSWGSTERFVLGLVALKANAASVAAANLYSAVNSEDNDARIEIASAAGEMFEVLEVDMSSMPADAVVHSVEAEISHKANAGNKLRVFPVAIQVDDSIVRVEEKQIGYIPLPLNNPVVLNTGRYFEFEDGSSPFSYDRFGLALVSSARETGLQSHTVEWARLRVGFDEGGPKITSVTAPASPGDPVEWAYESGSGLAQTHFQVVVQYGPNRDPEAQGVSTNPLAIDSVGEEDLIYDSGRLPGGLVRSFVIDDAPLSRGEMTWSVRAWATLSSGESYPSEWVSVNSTLGGALTAVDQLGELFYYPEEGSVAVLVNSIGDPPLRAWLQSRDAEVPGTSWENASGSPYQILGFGSEILVDYPPLGSKSRKYQVAFDEGPMTETSQVRAVPQSDDSRWTDSEDNEIVVHGGDVTTSPAVAGGAKYLPLSGDIYALIDDPSDTTPYTKIEMRFRVENLINDYATTSFSGLGGQKGPESTNKGFAAWYRETGEIYFWHLPGNAVDLPGPDFTDGKMDAKWLSITMEVDGFPTPVDMTYTVKVSDDSTLDHTAVTWTEVSVTENVYNTAYVEADYVTEGDIVFGASPHSLGSKGHYDLLRAVYLKDDTVYADLYPDADSVELAGLDLTPESWFIQAPSDPSLNMPVKVRVVSVDTPVKSVTVDQEGNSVSAVSKPLAKRYTLSLYVFSKDERDRLHNILSSGLRLRLTDIWGVSTFVRNVSGIGDSPQRWKPVNGEGTKLRHGHFYNVDFVEERNL